MNRKNKSYSNQQPVREQFQAYGEYSYTYQHQNMTEQQTGDVHPVQANKAGRAK